MIAERRPHSLGAVSPPQKIAYCDEPFQPERGITASHLAIKWIVPFHADAVAEILAAQKHTIIVENNHSGQFHRYLRSETGFTVDGHIRKYDGEPFMPHHIADGVTEQLAGRTDHYVPQQEVIV